MSASTGAPLGVFWSFINADAISHGLDMKRNRMIWSSASVMLLAAGIHWVYF